MDPFAYKDYDISQLLNHLYITFDKDISKIREFFSKEYKTNFVHKEINGKNIVSITYRTNNRLCTTPWLRQCRGCCFILLNDKFELVKLSLEKTLDYCKLKENSITKLDNERKNIFDDMKTKKENVKGTLTTKIDGCLLNVTIVPKSHKLYNPLKELMTGIDSEFVSDEKLLLFSSKSTFLTYSYNWYITSFLVANGIVSSQDIEKYENIEQAIKENIDSIFKLFPQEHHCTIAFEAVCPYRKCPFEKRSRSELCVTYNDYKCDFLGIMDVSTFNFSIENTFNYNQSSLWKFDSFDQVENMMEDLENISKGIVSEKEFFLKYPTFNNKNDLHMEGFVMYVNDKIPIKLKTDIFYLAHNIRKLDDIKKILEYPDVVDNYFESIRYTRNCIDNFDDIKDIVLECKEYLESGKPFQHLPREIFCDRDYETLYKIVLNHKESNFYNFVESKFKSKGFYINKNMIFKYKLWDPNVEINEKYEFIMNKLKSI